MVYSLLWSAVVKYDTPLPHPLEGQGGGGWGTKIFKFQSKCEKVFITTLINCACLFESPSAPLPLPDPSDML